MSDDVLKLIPADPHFVPSDAAKKAAVAALEKLLPEGERCRTEDFGRVTFIDQGENLESILCPACGTKLSLTARLSPSPTAIGGTRSWMS
jgi:hypothetical protein